MQLSDQLVLAGVLQAILYLFFVRAIDLYEREPLPYVVAVFLWGFAVATTIAVFFNTLAKTTFASLVSEQEANALTAIFVAPVVEESAKGLALLIVFVFAYLAALRRRGLVEFAGVMDGIVYGSAVSFGFALFEDIGYGMHYGAEAFIMRRILGGFGHAAFTSSTGIGFGLIPFANRSRTKIISPLLGLLVAIFMHSTFNFLATTMGPVAYLYMFIVVLVYLVLIIDWLNFERRSIRGELREEVEMGIISPEEYGHPADCLPQERLLPPARPEGISARVVGRPQGTLDGRGPRFRQEPRAPQDDAYARRAGAGPAAEGTGPEGPGEHHDPRAESCGVISAREESRKMGRDKLLVDVGGVSLHCRVQDRSRQKENCRPTAMGRKRSRHASQSHPAGRDGHHRKRLGGEDVLQERRMPGLRFLVDFDQHVALVAQDKSSLWCHSRGVRPSGRKGPS